MSWKHKAEKLWFDDRKSWNNITYALLPYFPNSGFDQVKQTIRGHIRGTERYKDAHQKEINSTKSVGVFSDPHIPFDHPGYLPFLIDTFKQFNVGQIVCCGDLTDQYGYSRFNKKPLAMGVREETELTREKIASYVKAFPRVKMCIGNHDTRYIDRSEENGIDEIILQDFKVIYNLPKTWEIYNEYDDLLIIDDVLYIHGSAYGGQYGMKDAARIEQMSTVIGHSHAHAGFLPVATKRKLMFGLNVGCGIDIKKYAFIYNKKDKFRPILGCGIVFSSTYAIFVPMGIEYMHMKG